MGIYYRQKHQNVYIRQKHHKGGVGLNDKAERFFQSIQNKQVWFVGLGVSHTPTTQMFAARGVPVTVCDKRSREQIGLPLCEALEAQGIRLLLGPDYPENFSGADILFRTPGMYYNLPILQEYRAQGGILTSEMEVFCSLCPCPLYAVTGSDGKTTTTTLIAEMLGAQGYKVHLGGNIGKALLPGIMEVEPGDRAVVELSSFQLISMRCAPTVSVVTNVAPNHLDVHGNMEEYTETKRGMVMHQDAFSSTVLNADNAIAAGFAPLVRGQHLQFSMEGPVSNGAYYNKEDGGLYTVRVGESPRRVMDASHIRLPGMHNVANYLAAICAVRVQVDTENIRRVAAEFAGVEHRIELVRQLDGVRWYNDSIATSPTRAIAGLRAFDRKIIMLAGGYDKKIPYAPLAPHVVDCVKLLILCGATADKIQDAVTSYPTYRPGRPEILRVDDVPAAVAAARAAATDGDIVSLCPASASFDSYPNFEVRGQHFKELVNAL